MKYSFNEITPNWIQIYGEINGFAIRSFDENQRYWSVSVFGFLDKNSVKLQTCTNVKNRTLRTLDDVKNWIDKAFTPKPVLCSTAA